MAVHNYLMVQSFKAGEDLSDKQNFFLKLNSDGEVILAVAGDAALGVNLENAEEDETTGAVTISGEKVEIAIGAAVAAGALLTSDAQGRAVTATTGNAVNGIALQAGTAAGQLVSMLFRPNGVVTA